MKYFGKITMPQKRLEQIHMYLNKEPKCEADCLPEDITITESFRFSDEYEMDIKCCGVQYEEGGSNTAWSEAVLFKNGCEVCCSEPSDNFEGEWTLRDGDNEFTVVVEAERRKE